MQHTYKHNKIGHSWHYAKGYSITELWLKPGQFRLFRTHGIPMGFGPTSFIGIFPSVALCEIVIECIEDNQLHEGALNEQTD